MAHYVASINIFEHQENATASLKVFRVFEYGAAPQRPVWDRQVSLERPDPWRPDAWLRQALWTLLEDL